MKRWISVFVLISVVGVLAPFLRQMERRIVGVEPGVRLDYRNMEYYLKDEVRTIVQQIAREIDQPEVNASIDKKSGGIIPEQNGIHVDVEATVELVMNAPANTHLEPVITETVPLVRTEHLEPLQAVIGDFSTPVMGSPGRVSNLRLSLAAINNTLVLPGEVFSFNEVVGERTPEKGYRPAPVIYGESVADAVGGGVCQVSTTLYNAVRRAGLEIVERRMHSIAPSYIRHGMDATVAWPHTDFKFRNNSESPIIVKGEIQGWRVRVWIIGRE
ncbi:MAG TPA: hypothetical protein GX739_07300 [Firmicutes bacterium]|nr:hypothetical protein [Bacillota bacterium]